MIEIFTLLACPVLVGALQSSANEVRPDELRTILLEGVVLTFEGAPARDARIASSAGRSGEGVVVDDFGFFQLEARVPRRAEQVEISAFSASGRASMNASIPSRSSSTIQVGVLWLSAGTESPSWEPTFGSGHGFFDGFGGALSSAVFDDGNGPALYVGGGFPLAGGVMANGIVKWDGSRWSTLGSGLDGDVFALVVYDDGGGADLYAGGTFSTADGIAAPGIARWDGSSWSAVGGGVGGGAVYAMVVFEDGGGDSLYVGGSFDTAGGGPAEDVAQWDGSSWSALGSGMAGNLHQVYALGVFDDGGGAELYAGGIFTSAGSAAADNIARWDGTSWSPLGSGMGHWVYALKCWDDGGGEALYAGGSFTTAGGVPASRLAKWDGSAWSPLGSGANSLVRTLEVHDDGGGAALYTTGHFTTIGGQSGIVGKWDGSSWTGIEGQGIFGARTLVSYDDGGGADLYTGGVFDFGNGYARWDGTGWSSVGNGLDDEVRALGYFDDGTGRALYAGGSFTQAGTQPLSRIGRWNGTGWEPLGSGVNGSVYALAEYDDGSGPALFVGGLFTSAGRMSASRITKWDGANWSTLGNGIPTGAVLDLEVFDGGNGAELYVAGAFPSPPGGSPNITRWDGSQWGSLEVGLNLNVNALEVFDDGTGPALYAGGIFSNAPTGPDVDRIAKWDGSSWSPLLGGGIGNTGDAVEALAVFDDGMGPALYAAGRFDMAGGVPVSNIARWDGMSWSAVGAGFDDEIVTLLSAYCDGPRLFAGGEFDMAGGVVVEGIAQWDGSTWSPLGQGVAYPGFVHAFADSGRSIEVGGPFRIVFSGDSFLARWSCPKPTKTAPSAPPTVPPRTLEVD